MEQFKISVNGTMFTVPCTHGKNAIFPRKSNTKNHPVKNGVESALGTVTF